MNVIKLSERYKVTAFDKHEIGRVSLNYNIFGANGKLYMNLASIPMTETFRSTNKKVFSPEELSIPHISRWHTLKFITRTHKDVYKTLNPMDFPELFAFVIGNWDRYMSIHADIEDAQTFSVPLNSNVFRNGSNYAHQEIVKLMQNETEANFKKFCSIF